MPVLQESSLHQLLGSLLTQNIPACFFQNAHLAGTLWVSRCSARAWRRAASASAATAARKSLPLGPVGSPPTAFTAATAAVAAGSDAVDAVASRRCFGLRSARRRRVCWRVSPDGNFVDDFVIEPFVCRAVAGSPVRSTGVARGATLRPPPLLSAWWVPQLPALLLVPAITHRASLS